MVGKKTEIPLQKQTMAQQQTQNSWQDKSLTLPAWKQDLLQNITILDEEQLHIDLYDTIYVVSNGEANL